MIRKRVFSTWQQTRNYSVYYRTEPNVRALQGLNGIQEQRVGKKGKYITAIDYKTGKIAWRHLQGSAGEGEGNTA